MKIKFTGILFWCVSFLWSTNNFAQSAFTLDNGGQLVLTGTANFVVQGGTNLTTSSSVINIGDGTLIIGGNINGTGTFSGSTSSILILNGTGGGTLNFTAGANTLKDFTLNRTGASVILNSPLTITGTLNLQTGVLNTTTTNLPVLGTSGALTGTLMFTTGQINGPFKRWFNNTTNPGITGDFPIGDGAIFYPARIEFTTAPTTPGTLTAQWMNVCAGNAGLPLTDGALNLINTGKPGFWRIDAGDGLAGGTYTSSLTATAFPGISNFTTLRTVKRPSGGTNWTIDGTAGTNTGTNAIPVIVRTGMSGFSEFAIAGAADNPLSAAGVINPALTGACSGSNGGTLTLSGYSGTVVQWETSTDDGVSWTPITNTTTTLTYTNLIDTTWYRALVQPVSCAPEYSAIAIINVNPIPVATATVPAQTTCSGSAITSISLNSTVSGTTYSWTRDNTAAVTGIAASGTGNISGTLTNTTNAPVTVAFTITPTANGCPGLPITATVTVNPVPNAVATPSPQTICSGAAISTIVLSGNVAGTVYNWNRDNTVSVTGIASSGSGNISGSLTNTTNAPVTVSFSITPSYTNAGTTCTGTAITATVVVNPVPNAVATPSLQTTCSGSAITPIVLSGNVAGTVYTWTRDNTGPVTGIAASGTGNISGTLTNTTNTPVTVTFTITPSYTNAGTTCTGTAITSTVVVNPRPNAVATPPLQTICSGAITPIVLTGNVAGTVYSWTRDNTVSVTGIAASGSGNISGTLTNTTGSQVTVTFTITPSFTNAGATCTGTPITATVTVNPTNTITLTSAPGTDNQTVLINTPVTNITYASTNATGATVTGLPAGVTGNWAGSVVTISGTPTVGPGVFNYTITLTGGCGAITANGTITVTVCSITRSSAAGTDNQVVCNNAPITNITYATTGATGATFSGLPAGVTGNWAADVVTISGTPTAAGIFNYTITPTGGGCSGAVTATGTITVNPIPTINAVASQTVCNGAATTVVIFSGSPAGTVYNWTNNAISIGLAASGTGNIAAFTAVNTGTAPVVATITVTPGYTNGGVSCTGIPIMFTITVNPTATIHAVANQVVCNGAPTAAVNFSSPATGGTIVYNWTNNTPSIGLAASGSGNIASFNAVNAGTAPIVANITVTPVYTNGGTTCNGTPITFTITINPTATVNAVANQVICTGAPTTAVNFSSPATGGAIVYNWTNNTTSIGLAASGTGNIASFTAINAGTAPVVATITVIPSYTNAGVTCAGTPGTFTITVNPTATVNTVPDQVVCNGAATTAVSFSSPATGGTTVYNWTNNTISIGLAASGSGNIASFNAVNTGSVPVTATITVTPVYSNGGTSCVGTPLTFTITVNPAATVNTVPDQVICNGAATAAVNFSSPVTGGSIVYNWTNNTTSIGLAANGSGNIASFNAVNTGTAPVTATITVIPTYTNGGTSCIGTATAFTLTVNPTVTVTTVPNQVVCNGAATVPVNFISPTTGGTIVYNWTNNTTSIGLAASGTGNIASFTAINTGIAPVAATIIVTPVYTNGGTTCTGTTTTFTITVNPTPTVNAAASQVVCNGAPTAAVSFSGAVPGTVYNWTNNTTSIGLAASGTGNIASFTATNTGTAPVVATIIVTPTYTNGGTTCTGTTTSFTITVNPTPTVNAAASQVVCNGAPTAAVSFSGAVPGTVYNWTNNTSSIGLGASGTGNIASFAAINTGTAPVVATIVVTPTYTNGGTTCTGTTTSFTLTVNPTATVNSVPDQVVCNGAATAAVNFGSPATGGTIVYNWTNNTAGIGLAASGSGNIASFTAINTGAAPVVATITVTPTYTNAGASCVGMAITFTITVNPTATVNPAPNQQVCNAFPTAPVNFSSAATGGTIVYNWTNNTASIGLAAGGSGNIASFIANNPGTAPVVATITVTPTYTNGGVSCTGTPISFTITVNPTPNATIIYTGSPYCSNGGAATVTRTGTAGGTYSSTAGLLINATTGDVNLGASTPGTYTVTYTIAAAGGCAVFTTTTTITITQLPAATISYAGTPYCSTAASAPVTRTGTAGGTYSAVPAGLTINVTTGTVTPNTSTPGIYTVTYTIPAGAGCPVVTATTTITITQAPNMIIFYAGTPYCSNAGTATVSRFGTTGGTYSAAPAGLSINATTGAVTLATSTPGTYTVTYSVTAPGCGTTITQTTITVTAAPNATIAYTGSPYCSNAGTANVTFTGTPSGGSYTAAPAGLTLNATTGAVTLATSTPGIYTVTYSVGASGGCGAYTTTATITVTALPAATIAYTGSPYCSNAGTATVTRSGTAGGTYTAAPAGLTLNAITGAVTLATSTAGTYTVTYTLAAGGGCPAVTATTTITITALPAATITYGGNPYCQVTGTATVTRTGTAGGTYSAAPAGLSINATTGAVTLATSTPGTYTVTYTIAAGGGCGAVTATATITVNALSVDPTGATATASSLCGPGTVSLSVTGGTLGGGATWRWYTGSCGGTPAGTGSTLTATVNTTTTYFVRAEGACNTTACASVTVTVNTQPTISVVTSATTLKPHQTATLTATVSPTAGITMTWYRNGVAVPGATGATLVAGAGEVGVYTARATTGAGCTSLSNAVTITAAGSNQLFITPNPNNGRFKVRYYTSATQPGFLRHLVMFDEHGQRVFDQTYPITAPYSSMDIDARHLPKGFYIVMLTDAFGNEVLGTGKVILQ